ncbi:MAG: AAA family ATPase [Planctomycetota bacterium]
MNPEALAGGERPLHRDFQLSELRPCFVPQAGPALHAWVHGPPGTGKTLCVQHLLGEARTHGMTAVYVNCRECPTCLAVVERNRTRSGPFAPLSAAASASLLPSTSSWRKPT